MSLTFVSWTKQLEITCAYTGKFGVYVNASDALTEGAPVSVTNKMFELNASLPLELFTRSIVNGDLALFENEREAQEFYSHFHKPPLGDSSVYACIVSPSLGFINENT